MPSSLLAVFAHPDDESFGIAGTAMKLIDAKHEVALLTLTRGDAGLWFGRERGSWRREELAAERAREWEGAVREIGFQRSWLLDWPDGGLGRADADAITCDVVRVIRDFRPDVVVTFGPEGAGSEHDEHATTSRLCARAPRLQREWREAHRSRRGPPIERHSRWGGVRRAADPAPPDEKEAAGRSPRGLGEPHAARRLFFTTAPEGAGGLRGRRPAGFLSPTRVVDIAAYAARKARAYEQHRTQFKDREFFYELLERRGGKEHFHLAIDREGAPPAGALL